MLVNILLFIYREVVKADSVIFWEETRVKTELSTCLLDAGHC